MSRKGRPNKVQSGISYPRKCSDCDYVANNPSMYHYHKKTHLPIPEGQLCDHGCGQLATVMGTGGVYACLPNAHRCPAYIARHSVQIAQQWADPKFDERKAQTKERFLKSCCNNEEVRARQKATIQQKFGYKTAEQATEYRHYVRRLRKKAQQWAKEQGHILGNLTLHVDHKFSLREAWRIKLHESIVNHPANLEVIESTQNSSKGSKCSITLGQLFAEILLCE